MEPIPLSLYLHIPWCVRKCPYCDFNSHQLKQAELPETAYVDAVLRDLEHDLPLIWGRRIHTIFIGGGTPSLLSADAMATLMSGLRARLNFSPNIEITLEANPGTVEQERFAAYREHGINRLSLGIQSFDADKLRRLGRIHNGEEAVTAIETAQKVGFENFNLDLMFGLPQQTVDEGLADVQQACRFQPTHLSWYQLTLEPNTLFYRQPPPLPLEEDIEALFEQGTARLTQAGYGGYEVSAYALPGFECQHNLNYWQFGDYLGIGAGAHAKITDVASGKIFRYHKYRHPKEYLQCTDQFIAGQRELSATETLFEFMLNALRLTAPVSARLFENRTGLDWAVGTAQFDVAERKGLIVYDANALTVTALGRRFLNDLTALFLADD